MVSCVCTKLLITAVRICTKESLTSLIGVTSVGAKTKSYSNKPDLTHKSKRCSWKRDVALTFRAPKKKNITWIAQMQTAEAERLNAVTQKLAATLYTKGYGPGLTQGKRRAYGHIPNFRDPERAQAARGGMVVQKKNKKKDVHVYTYKQNVQFVILNNQLYHFEP